MQRTNELPKQIISHPYFHKDIDEEKAKKIVTDASEDEGNYLFCKSNVENKILCIYKVIEDGIPLIWTSKHEYSEKFKAFRLNESVAHPRATLLDIIRYHSCLINKFLALGLKSISFNPKPISNEIAQKQLQLKPVARGVIPPLPNGVAGLIFEYLDLNALCRMARVSQSSYALFGAKLHSVISVHEKEEQIRIHMLVRQKEHREENKVYCGWSIKH